MLKSTSPEKMSASATLRSGCSPADAIAAKSDEVSRVDVAADVSTRVTRTSYGTTSATNSPGGSAFGVIRSTLRPSISYSNSRTCPLPGPQEPPGLALVHPARIEDAFERSQHRLELIAADLLAREQRAEVFAAA